MRKQNQESIDAATAEVKKEGKDSGFADNTDAVHSNSPEETGTSASTPEATREEERRSFLEKYVTIL